MTWLRSAPGSGRRCGGAGRRSGPGRAGGPPQPVTPADLMAQAARAARTYMAQEAPTADDGDADSEREVEHRYLGSTVERLAGQDFAALSAAELESLAELMRGITLAVPRRPSRRQRRGPGGPRLDPRSTPPPGPAARGA